jgi:hypothetical protein
VAITPVTGPQETLDPLAGLTANKAPVKREMRVLLAGVLRRAADAKATSLMVDLDDAETTAVWMRAPDAGWRRELTLPAGIRAQVLQAIDSFAGASKSFPAFDLEGVGTRQRVVVTEAKAENHRGLLLSWGEP